MPQKINFQGGPEAGQVGAPHSSDSAKDNAVADAELMVWGAKAALKTAERNLRVAYETLASVLGASEQKVAAPVQLASANQGAKLASGPGDASSGPDATG